MKKFRLTLKHDYGKINFIIFARNEDQAKQIVCECEGCPQCAIIKVKEL
jgi:hypothetical protein